MKIFLLLLLLLVSAPSAWAVEDLATPDGISPTMTEVATETTTPVPPKLGEQVPSQSEEEKAPETSRATAVPKFSLPDVVITGKNELTIGASRLETLESDVSWGAESLTQVNRSTDDLPGLDKSLTALSTQETGPSQDTSVILHAGAGDPGTWGGWGLFGRDFEDMQYILYGYYSTWGGEPTHGSTDGDQKYRFGGEFKLTPDKDTHLRLSIYSAQVQDNLPYQGAVTETHQGLDTKADLGWKWDENWNSDLFFTGRITTLNYWDGTALSNQAQEYKESFELTGKGIDPVWDSLHLEAGDYQESSNFMAPVENSDNLAWARLGLGFILAPGVKLSGSLEGQTGNGTNLSSKLFPEVDLDWRWSEPTLLHFYWKTERSLDSFYDDFMDKEHIAVLSGLSTATEITGEWGGKLTQQLEEDLILGLSASTAAISNYHQWTDIDPSGPNFIETYTSLPSVQITTAKADLQWKLDSLWRTDWVYQWTSGNNNSGNNLNLTFLPQNQGTISLTRTDEQWDGTLSFVVVSDRQALDAANLDLPAFATFNLSAAYHFDRNFSLWFRGDNLLGLNYALEPGYSEPEVHLRGGIEIVL